MMEIGEKDIFYYVFYPEKLDTEKLKYIKNNKKLFSNEILQYENSKKAVEKPVPHNILEKIYKKIEEKQQLTKIELHKFEVKQQVYQEYRTLAADSPEEKQKGVTVDTYIDPGNNYIIKVLNFENKNKIYVFEKDQEELENFSLKIFPSGMIYKGLNSTEPLIIEPKVDVEKIVLNFE